MHDTKWKNFRDEMPEADEPLLIMYLDDDAEESFSEGKHPGVKGSWFHMAFGAVIEEGFGFAFYDTDGDKVSAYQHELLRQSGRWVYVSDIAKRALPFLPLGGDESFILVHGTHKGPIWIEAKQEVARDHG